MVMPVLAAAKKRVAMQPGGDQLILPMRPSGLYQLSGAAWLDPVAGFVIAASAIREGREAWEGELLEDDD